MPVNRRPLEAVLAASIVSVTGDSLTQLGVPWYVLASTGSSARAGIVAFCALFPVTLSASASGPVIDRVGRVRISVISDLTCGVSIAAIPLLQMSGFLQFWMLCGLMALAGMASAPGTTARSVLVPVLADLAGARLVRVASLYDGAARCASMIGAATGGVLITAFGPSHVLLADAASFGLSAALVGFGTGGPPAVRQAHVSWHGYGHSMREGFRNVLGMPLLLGMCVTSLAAQGLDQGWSSVLLPMDVRAKLGSVLDLGMLETVFALCALTGALLYGGVGHRWRRWPVFAVAFLIVGMPRFVVAALTDGVVPLAVMMGIEGLACGALNPIRTTVVYEVVPDRLRGQVTSAMSSVGLLAAPFGGLVAGFFVQTTGLPTTMLTTGAVYLAVTLWPALSPSWRAMDQARSVPERSGN